ncbi:uncharacterized protein LOC135817769 [Sycon ciliatum]|uniref:uncharacterized protein LOC135817769 n=1 Tax=Sycon ciliatum TaxID=27933 RepID=UPI0031F6C9F7
MSTASMRRQSRHGHTGLHSPTPAHNMDSSSTLDGQSMAGSPSTPTSSMPVHGGSRSSDALEALSVAFWGSKLRMSGYTDGDQLVDYDSLWPSGCDLRNAVEDFRQSELEYAVLDCCRLTVLCGPVRVLKALLTAKIVSVDQMFQPHGVTLMHMACVAQLPDVVTMLKEFKPANKPDLLNRTAQELCLDRATRERLSAVRRVGGALRRAGSRASSAVAKNLAKGEIFQMAAEPMKCVELLIQMQRLDFEVDAEKDDDGNCVVHLVTSCGISQVGTLLCLQRLFKADFDLYNEDGMTPLCIAAHDGCLPLCELLMCVLGASPNKPNNLTGWTPLHFAASQCHIDVVLSFIRRGALVNLECKMGSLPDDVIPRGNPTFQEAQQLLVNERMDRMNRLTSKAKSGSLHWNDVHPSDQFVINSSGNTLLMEAAENNRSGVVNELCNLENAPINAQHFKTGLTAVAMCATGGCVGSLQQLLKHGADPRIVDMDGMLALHHACRWRNIDCVVELVKPAKGLHGLAAARKYTNDSQILAILDDARKRRQEEVIKPLLFDSVAKGDLEAIGAFPWEEGEDDVNVRNSYNEWPLLLAAQNGHADIVRMLHKLGGRVNQYQEDSGNTPLHAACRGGHFAVVEFLLNFTASRSQLSPTSSTGSVPVSPLALTKPEPLLDINQRNTSGHTSLELAVSQGHARIIESLCERGASCTLPDSSGHLLESRQFMGVQVMLKKFRQQHMDQIVATFMRKKDLAVLKGLWVSPHDHSLRNEIEESPLMVACSNMARMEILHFLLSDIRPATTPETQEAERPFSPQRRPASTTSGMETPDQGNGRGRKMSTPIPRSFAIGDTADMSATPNSKHYRRGTTSADSVFMLPRQSHSMATIPDTNDDEVDGPNVRKQLAFHSSSNSQDSSTGSRRDLSGFGRDDMLNGGFDPFAAERPPSPMDSSLPGLDETHQLVAQMSLSESDISLSGGSMHTLPWREPQNDMLLAQARDGGTALHRAVKAAFVKAVPALIAADARIVNVADHNGNTPLHLACLLKQNKIVKILLKCPESKLNMQNCDLQLPEDIAPRSMSKEMANRRLKMADGATKVPPPRRRPPSALDLPAPPEHQPIIRHNELSPILDGTGGASLDFDEVEEQLLRLKAGRT